MGKLYKISGIPKNKEIKKERKKPLPFKLMLKPKSEVFNETGRIRIGRGDLQENSFNSEII